MSDPRYTDPYSAPPRPSDPHLSDPVLSRDEGSPGMWGWIAGVAVLALIAFVVIAGWSANQNTASNSASPPAATNMTRSAPAANPPSTTGSGTTTPAPQAPPANR